MFCLVYRDSAADFTGDDGAVCVTSVMRVIVFGATKAIDYLKEVVHVRVSEVTIQELEEQRLFGGAFNWDPF